MAPRAELLLTFDDGPKLDITPKVLEELHRRELKAIFFVNGWNFERNPRAQELLRNIVAQGHYVGNHTYAHKVLCRHLDLAPSEIDRNEELIQKVLGFRPLLLRTPYGQHCKRLKQVVTDRGYNQIGWNVDGQEWRSDRKPEQVARSIIARLSRASGRVILLMHDSREKTLAVLPMVLDWLAVHPEIKIVSWEVLENRRATAHAGLLEAFTYFRGMLFSTLPLRWR